MSSSRDDIADLLLAFPWWANCLLAALTYLALTFILPSLATENQILRPLFRIAPSVAPIFTALFLLAAALSALHARRRAKRFAATRTIEEIRNLSWRQFESYVAEGFRKRGYKVQETAEGSDGGIDVVIVLDGKKYLVQCKHWKSNSLGVEKVRELAGVVQMRAAAGGILVTTGRFTSEARESARDSIVELVDGDELLVRFGVALQPIAKAAHVPAAEQTCPKCGAAMERKIARKGSRTGKAFWGCVRFPSCKGLINISD